MLIFSSHKQSDAGSIGDSYIRYWLISIFLFLIFTPIQPVFAQSNPTVSLRVELLSPGFVPVAPGDIITAGFQVTNTYSDCREIRIDVDVPDNWKSEVNPEVLELDPGQTEISFVTLTVPVDAPPGEFDIFLSAYPAGELSERSGVGLIASVAILVNLNIQQVRPDQPDAVAGDRIIQTFLLSNRGNSINRVRIEILAN